jgi:hypothetical protein
VPAADPDLPLRQAAVARARELAEAYDDLVPLPRLREGFVFEGQRVSFGSFQRGIHRGRDQRGPAALTLTTSFNDPYADTFDEAGRCSPTPTAPALSTSPITARCAPRTRCRLRSSTSVRWRRASTWSSRQCS